MSCHARRDIYSVQITEGERLRQSDAKYAVFALVVATAPAQGRTAECGKSPMMVTTNKINFHEGRNRAFKKVELDGENVCSKIITWIIVAEQRERLIAENTIDCVSHIIMHLTR